MNHEGGDAESVQAVYEEVDEARYVRSVSKCNKFQSFI